MVHACCAYGCKNVFKKGDGLGFFRFPHQKHRSIQWTVALRRKDFVPSSSTRICGDHFQTGRPSRDINHPDYVPNIFTFNDEEFDIKAEKRKKRTRGQKKELLEDIRELSIFRAQNEENIYDASDQEQSDNTTTDSDSNLDEYPEIKNEKDVKTITYMPEFEPIKKSPFISVETVKMIINNDAENNPDAVPDPFSMLGKARFPQKVFTFIDVNGKVIAKFAEKKLRKNARLEKYKRRFFHVYTSSQVKQKVQVILDRRTAKTAYVDVDSIPHIYPPGPCKFKQDIDESYVMKNSNNNLYTDTSEDAYLNFFSL